MKRAFLAGFLIAAGILLFASPPAWAGLPEGVAAMQKGDYATAWRELRPLADSGNAAAQYNLGLLYAEGRGVAQNDVEAASWYRKSAEQGYPLAQNNLGALFNRGQGVARPLPGSARPPSAVCRSPSTISACWR